MKVLFLTYDLPYPLISGGKIRAYYLLKNLSQNHEITLFSYYRQEEQKKYLPELKKHCQSIFLFKRRKPWSWQNLLRSFLTPLPFTAATYYSPPLKKALEKELKENKYDLVHFESFYPALYLPLVKKMGIKTLMGNENIEYQVYNRYANQQFFFFRWLLKLEILKMRLFEEKLWQLTDVNLALSKEDATAIKKVTKKDCFVIPNGADPNAFKNIRMSQEERNLIFVGTLIYQANNDAIRFFLKEIYPEIVKRDPKVKFVLVSWYQPSWLKIYLADPSIKFIQDKETPASEFFQQGNIFIAPMRVASGTNIKILEAMAAGLPVVTTSAGIEGIEAKQGQEALVENEPLQFAQETVKLFKDKSRYQRLGKAGQALVKKLYDWSKISEKLEEVYRKQA